MSKKEKITRKEAREHLAQFHLASETDSPFLSGVSTHVKENEGSKESQLYHLLR